VNPVDLSGAIQLQMPGREKGEKEMKAIKGAKLKKAPKRIKSIRNLHFNTIDDKKEVKKLGKKTARTCGEILRAQVPENLLASIRRQCLDIKSLADALRKYDMVGSLWQNASILLQDQEEGENKTYWLYQAPEEHFKIFVNRKFIPILVGGDIPVDPPQDKHVDITFLEPMPGHMISIDQTAWKREGAGSEKAA